MAHVCDVSVLSVCMFWDSILICTDSDSSAALQNFHTTRHTFSVEKNNRKIIKKDTVQVYKGLVGSHFLSCCKTVSIRQLLVPTFFQGYI